MGPPSQHWPPVTARRVLLCWSLPAASSTVTHHPQHCLQPSSLPLQAIWPQCHLLPEFPGGSEVKNPPANTGGAGDAGSIPAWERFLEGANVNTLQNSFWENVTDRGAWRAIVHRLQRVGHDWLNTHKHTHIKTHYLLLPFKVILHQADC